MYNNASKQLSKQALSQIQSLLEEKISRSPEQQKISSQLIYARKMHSKTQIALGIEKLQTTVKIDREDKTLVEITADITPNLLQEIKKTKTKIISSFVTDSIVYAQISIGDLESIARLPEVKFIAPPAKWTSQKRDTNPPSNIINYQSKAQLHSQLSSIIANLNAKRNTQEINPNIGSVSSEGDTAHRADESRKLYNVTGAGIKIGVLSDSYNSKGGATNDVIKGELPGVGNPNGYTTPVTVLEDYTSDSSIDEGRAMLQIIHDIAPGAQLFFATGCPTRQQLALNIDRLRQQNCDIIVDDIVYFDEFPFQDDLIARAVNRAIQSGRLYFSSAGNSGNKDDRTSGVWEGDFLDSGMRITYSKGTGIIHSFGGGNTSNFISKDTPFEFDLFWSDPLGKANNDYDLFLFDGITNKIISASTNFQTGTQNPFEFIGSESRDDKNNRLVIVKFNGDARFLHLNTNRGQLTLNTPGQTRGHKAGTIGPPPLKPGKDSGFDDDVAQAFSVAAVDAKRPVFTDCVTNKKAQFQLGAFNGEEKVECFSSDGPRRVFFFADGSPITSKNFSSTGGKLLNKPDIAAADGVSTTFPSDSGLNPFFGTSAAAPHAAAIAALVMSFAKAKSLNLTPAQIRTVLTSTALDIELPSVDRDSGNGIVMAFQALSFIDQDPNISSFSINATPTSQIITPKESTVYNINSKTIGGNPQILQLSVQGLPLSTKAEFSPPTVSPATPSNLVVTTSPLTPNGVYTLTITGTGGNGLTHNYAQVELIIKPESPQMSSFQFDSAGYNTQEGLGKATITITRTGNIKGTASVDFATSGGTATPSLDYIPVTKTLTFSPGQQSQTVTIPIIDDTAQESDETVILTLSNPTGGAVLGNPSTATLTITDNDQANHGKFIFGAYAGSVSEGDGMATILILRIEGQAGTATVQYATADCTNPGCATAGADYTPVSGTLTFADGESSKTFTIPIIDDTLTEGDEPFNLILSNPTGGATLGIPIAILTVRDNDMGLTAAPWPMIGHDAQHTNRSPFIAPQQLTTLQITNVSPNSVIPSPIAIDRNKILYLPVQQPIGSTTEGRLYALNADGSIRPGWPFIDPARTAINGSVGSPAIGADGTIYIVFGQNIYAVNSNGNQVWQTPFTTSTPIFSSPVVDSSGTIYVIGEFLYAINPNGTLKWQVFGFDTVNSPAISITNTTIFASGGPSVTQAGGLTALNLDGSEKWSFSYGGTINNPTFFSSPVVAANGTVYTVKTDALGVTSVLMALDPVTGAVLNQRGVLKPFSARGFTLSIAPDGSIVYATAEQRLLRLSPDLATVQLDYSTTPFQLSSIPAIGADGTMYFSIFQNTGNKILAISPDGILKGEIVINDIHPTSGTISSEGKLYIGGDNLYTFQQ